MIRVAEPAAALPIAGGEMGTKSERKRHFRASATEKMTPACSCRSKVRHDHCHGGHPGLGDCSCVMDNIGGGVIHLTGDHFAGDLP